MRAVIQRVHSAKVEVDQQIVGQIARGLLVFVGVADGDDDSDVRFIADKLIGLRIFPDETGKMNLHVLQVGGQILVVSQFTLLGDCRRGRRPDFTSAAPPARAQALYESLCSLLRSSGVPVETGRFAADMQVHLINDGPVTIWLDSRSTR
jgi:D-tyrosyl-tRNA(Tyr) deacylase